MGMARRDGASEALLQNTHASEAHSRMTESLMESSPEKSGA